MTLLCHGVLVWGEEEAVGTLFFRLFVGLEHGQCTAGLNEAGRENEWTGQKIPLTLVTSLRLDDRSGEKLNYETVPAMIAFEVPPGEVVFPPEEGLSVSCWLRFVVPNTQGTGVLGSGQRQGRLSLLRVSMDGPSGLVFELTFEGRTQTLVASTQLGEDGPTEAR